MEKATPLGQNEVFHTLSYNIPHLDTWVDEIIRLTEKSLPAKANPTTQDMVESVHRYDACFREMLRQTNTFSPDLTRIYAKLWIGVLGLLDSMVKMYHRHVTQTASLQEQARELIHQRQAQVAATKIKQEEEVLERTALRATIRNLEAEIDAIKSSNRELDRENRGLRALVETYIDARDFDRTLLSVVANGQSDAKGDMEAMVPGKKRSAADSSRAQMETLNHLDVQINESSQASRQRRIGSSPSCHRLTIFSPRTRRCWSRSAANMSNKGTKRGSPQPQPKRSAYKSMRRTPLVLSMTMPIRMQKISRNSLQVR
jgi:hypothetical protein